MLSTESLAAVEALLELERILGEQARYEAQLDRNKKGWVDPKVLHEIYAAESDVEPHFSVGEQVDLDDIRYAIRAELGRDFGTADLRLRDGDPERWYECGQETWQPEEPAVWSDLTIFKIAKLREARRKRYKQEYEHMTRLRGGSK